ncbi:MAG: serine hydrolase [Candidatus Promineifilaceae bacterium]
MHGLLRPFPLQFHPMWRTASKLTLLFFLLLGIVACERPSAAATVPLTELQSNPVAAAPATPTLANTAVPTLRPTATAVLPTHTPTSTATVPPITAEMAANACGQRLPLLAQNNTPTVIELAPDPAILAALLAELPAAARPAWDELVTNPGSVGLVAYRVGDEANGIYHNADMQMPLASVVKIVHLVAYAEAVAAGQLDPTSYVTVDTLNSYYLPGYDLGSHNLALDELTEKGLVLSAPDRVRLEDVPWMMMRHSANAATDYLQLLLGQAVIEETAVSLNLTQQTAPCTFLGQFMAMSNQTRQGSSDRLAIEAYLDNPASYGLEVAQLAETYIQDSAFREAEQTWHREERRPSTQDQRFFSHSLNAHGTPREYAALMAQIAQNGLSNPESSFLARRYLEWPMIFPANQERFSNLGYKNGSLPGILNTAYYAYPIGEVTPTVVILFFRDLPGSTYRAWRNNLAHDEFARWLLDNPQGLGLLKAALTPAP